MIDMHKTFFDNRFSAKVILQGRAEDVFTSPTLGAKFVLVPAGTFQTGKFGKQRQTTINKPFYIQKTHVTQGQWKKVMEDNPSFFKNGGDDCPVENVSWNDVQKFIIKLNNMEGTDKYRLPTESQWEYAARSGGKLEDYAGTLSESELGDYAWYYVNSGGETHPVGQKKPNGLGLYDMSGNVWQWVADWYRPDYYSQLQDNGSIAIDPHGPSGSFDPQEPGVAKRVQKGGSYLCTDQYCERYIAGARGKGDPDTGTNHLGFRCVRAQ